jgi:hypothetical protein
MHSAPSVQAGRLVRAVPEVLTYLIGVQNVCILQNPGLLAQSHAYCSLMIMTKQLKFTPMLSSKFIIRYLKYQLSCLQLSDQQSLRGLLLQKHSKVLCSVAQPTLPGNYRRKSIIRATESYIHGKYPLWTLLPFICRPSLPV